MTPLELAKNALEEIAVYDASKQGPDYPHVGNLMSTARQALSDIEAAEKKCQHGLYEWKLDVGNNWHCSKCDQLVGEYWIRAKGTSTWQRWQIDSSNIHIINHPEHYGYERLDLLNWENTPQPLYGIDKEKLEEAFKKHGIDSAIGRGFTESFLSCLKPLNQKEEK